MAFVTDPTKLNTRYISVRITLSQADFIVNGEDKGSTLVINEPTKNYKNDNDYFTINARIIETLSNNLAQNADITIYGLSQELINQISTLGYVLNYNFNTIQIYAGYDASLSNLVYSGYIIKAWADYGDVNRPLNLQCTTNYLMQLDNPPATNPQGNVDIAQTFSSLADKMGFGFSNSGVSGQIDSPILSGSYPEQVKTLAKQTNTTFGISNNMLAIAPNGQGLHTAVYEIDNTTGLLGYPVIDQWGIRFRIRFNPLILLGQYVNVQSIVPKANGSWYIYSKVSELNNRHEAWYTELRVAANSNIIQTGDSNAG
jgi:hypothetical protein